MRHHPVPTQSKKLGSGVNRKAVAEDYLALWKTRSTLTNSLPSRTACDSSRKMTLALADMIIALFRAAKRITLDISAVASVATIYVLILCGAAISPLRPIDDSKSMPDSARLRYCGAQGHAVEVESAYDFCSQSKRYLIACDIEIQKGACK